ncbi:MAG TPA: T9SS type A sorting domain-containing protein, partial [Puia sp.]|nr:T9SS type A sorting domain-containing protein [Puia sp.]
MKALVTLLFNLAALLLFVPPKVTAQTFTYNFSAPTMEVNAGSGGLAVGSIYLYSKIDVTQKTDAIVKITAATGGLSLSTFDQDNTANGGYTQAFQPTIVVPGTGGSGTVNGYVEFTFTFIKTGSYNTSSQSGTLFPQTSSIPATVLDDDGTLTGGTLYEYDELNLGTGEAPDYTLGGAQLSFSTTAGFVTGTNVTGTNYSGISNTATAVMFTVLNTNISTMTFRTGVKSTFTAAPAGRVSSLAFYMPVYPNAVLASSPIGAFHGVEAGSSIQLNWQLNTEQGLANLDLERTIDGGSYQTVKSYVFNDSGSTAPFTFTDAGLPSGASVAYRLKASSAAGNSWYSEVINFKLSANRRFNVYPNPVVSTANVTFFSETPGTGTLQLLDYSGHVVWRQQVYLNQGNNSLFFLRPTGLPAGNYIAILQTGEETSTQK